MIKKIIDTYYKTIKKLDINYFSAIFIFLECYKDEIMLLLKVHYSLNPIIPETFDLLKEIIKNYEIKEDEKKKNLNNDENLIYEMNENFIILIESYIKLLFKNKDKIALFQNEKNNIYGKIKIIENNFNQIIK